MDLVVKNARLVTETGTLFGGLAISDGRIEQILPAESAIQAEEVFDAQGKVVLPGLVDDHVHFSEPGRTHWEGYETGCKAAAAGGITTAVEMPLNAIPPTTSVEALREKLSVVREKCVVDFALWGGLVNNNLSDLDALHAAGVIGFKAFMSDSGTEYARVDDDLLYEGLRFAKAKSTVIGVHAENEWLTRHFANELKKHGRKDRAAWSESRPPETELDAVRRACFWAGKSGGNLHVVHVTIADGVREIAEARRKGVHVTAETCPHYLFFDSADFERIGPAAKCAPPIRTRAIVEDLWRQVLDGHVDTIGSDHSPCLWEEKAAGMEDIWLAWGGISGIQCTLPVLFTEGVHKRGLPLHQLALLTATNPAKIFGLYPRKGALLPGADADFVVVDPDEAWTLTPDHLLVRNRHSAYLGSHFKGRVQQTYVRGKRIYDRGEIVSSPGWGRWIRGGELFK